MSVGVLHPGEMGAAVAAVARDEVWWAPEGRSEATAERARAAGLRPAPLDELLESLRRDPVDLPAARGSGRRARRAPAIRGIYCDANAVSPETAREVARAVGGDVVDGGIVGGPPREPGTRLYLSGGRAAEVAALFDGTPLEPVVLGDEVGHRLGAEDVLRGLDEGLGGAAADGGGGGRAARPRATSCAPSGSASIPGLAERLARAERSADAKGWRWVGEMREIEATFRAAGLPGGFHEAAAETFERR